MMNRIIPIMGLVILAACGAEKKNQSDESVRDTIVTEPKQNNTNLYYHNIKEDDPFVDSFKRFFTDSLFQLSHINYPLVCSVMDDTGGYFNTEIPKGQWAYVNLIGPQGVYDNYSLEVKPSEDGYIVTQRGIDNGIFVEYWFMQNDDGWVLEKLRNLSN